jgi:hypothetical protein
MSSENDPPVAEPPNSVLRDDGLLVQHLNPLSGVVEWVVEPAETSGVAESLYLCMLNDSRRNEAYKQALKSSLKKGDLVLDIGECSAHSSLTSLMAVSWI